MLRVRDLAEAARRLDAAAFEAQLGPFALMQRPRVEAPASRHKMATLFVKDEELAAPLEFEELLVAILAAPRYGGQMRNLVIGRDPDCDLVVDDQATSGHHAAIRWNQAGATIFDLESTNGIYVNGRKIIGSAWLTTGAHVGFGRSHFVFMRTADLHSQIRRVIYSSD